MKEEERCRLKAVKPQAAEQIPPITDDERSNLEALGYI